MLLQSTPNLDISSVKNTSPFQITISNPSNFVLFDLEGPSKEQIKLSPLALCETADSKVLVFPSAPFSPDLQNDNNETVFFLIQNIPFRIVGFNRQDQDWFIENAPELLYFLLKYTNSLYSIQIFQRNLYFYFKFVIEEKEYLIRINSDMTRGRNKTAFIINANIGSMDKDFALLKEIITTTKRVLLSISMKG